VLQHKNDGTMWLYDNGSTQGTFLNKARLPKNEYVQLYVNDLFTIGSSVRRYFVRGPVEMERGAVAKKKNDQAKRRMELHAKQKEDEQNGITRVRNEDDSEDSVESDDDSYFNRVGSKRKLEQGCGSDSEGDPTAEDIMFGGAKPKVKRAKLSREKDAEGGGAAAIDVSAPIVVAKPDTTVADRNRAYMMARQQKQQKKKKKGKGKKKEADGGSTVDMLAKARALAQQQTLDAFLASSSSVAISAPRATVPTAHLSSGSTSTSSSSSSSSNSISSDMEAKQGSAKQAMLLALRAKQQKQKADAAAAGVTPGGLQGGLFVRGEGQDSSGSSSNIVSKAVVRPPVYRSAYDAADESGDWVAPSGQSGDGRTSLNDKLGY
jgi:hypothetical protein